MKKSDQKILVSYKSDGEQSIDNSRKVNVNTIQSPTLSKTQKILPKLNAINLLKNFSIKESPEQQYILEKKKTQNYNQKQIEQRNLSPLIFADQEALKRKSGINFMFTSFTEIAKNNKSLLSKFEDSLNINSFENSQIHKRLEHNTQQSKKIEENIQNECNLTLSQLKEQQLKKITQDKIAKKIRIIKKITQPQATQNILEKSDQDELEQIDNNLANKHLLHNLQFINSYKLYAYVYEQPHVKPENREGASLVFIENKGYLQGGRSSILIQEILAFDLIKLKWEVVSQSGDIPDSGRFCHSAEVYNKNIIIFGGETGFNERVKVRCCLNDVRIYNVDNKKWKFIKTSGEVIEARRSFTSVVVGKSLLVHGGLNDYGRYLNDLWELNLSTLKWSKIQPESQETNHLGIAYHSCASAFEFQPYSLTRLNRNAEYLRTLSKDRRKMVKEEGIYFFGGKNEHGDVLNTLSLLKPVEKNNSLTFLGLKWCQPEVYGLPPSQRYCCTMNFVEQLYCIVVVGGRNDQQRHQFCMKDIYILNLENMTWCNVNLHIKKELEPRYSHCSAVSGSKLFIFGGINLAGYVDSEMHIIELDQVISKRMISEEKEGKKRITYLQQKTNGDQKQEIQQQNEIISSLQLNKQESVSIGGSKLKNLIKKKIQEITSYMPLPDQKRYYSFKKRDQTDVEKLINIANSIKGYQDKIKKNL